MKAPTLLSRPLRHALASGLAALLPAPLAWAQAAPATTTDAATLARYDKNHNGQLDSDELAALQADQAKVAAAPTATGASGGRASAPMAMRDLDVRMSVVQTPSSYRAGPAPARRAAYGKCPRKR